MSDLLPTKTESDVFANISQPFYNVKKITDSLQGSIWRANTTETQTENSRTIVAKLTSKEQYNSSVSVINNTVYANIKENIVLEQSIVKYLTQQSDCSPFITKFASFLETDEYFIFFQEDGGYSLFEFVKTAHSFIRCGKIEIAHWKKVVKVIFKQLFESIKYIHSKNVTHNDISLENYLINDVSIVVNEAGKIRFETDNIQIKLCDFGLAELHTNSECLSSKHCGKLQYKSPEIISLKRLFAAKKNDIWCIGICLFILSFGCPPWKQAHVDDALYSSIVMGGYMMDVLKAWNLTEYIDSHCIDCLGQIFTNEEKRISVSEMKQHIFLR